VPHPSPAWVSRLCAEPASPSSADKPEIAAPPPILPEAKFARAGSSSLLAGAMGSSLSARTIGVNWNQRGATLPRGESAAGLRFRAYRQKMRCGLSAQPTHPSRAWVGHPLFRRGLRCGRLWDRLRSLPMLREIGEQITTGVSGRAISVLIDPADTTGKHGAAGRCVWRSLEIH